MIGALNELLCFRDVTVEFRSGRLILRLAPPQRPVTSRQIVS